jgi:hypothetical protein
MGDDDLERHLFPELEEEARESNGIWPAGTGGQDPVARDDQPVLRTAALNAWKTRPLLVLDMKS